MNASIATSEIPSPAGIERNVITDFDTADIMKLVLDCYKRNNNQLSSFSQSLRGNTVKETCYNVWQFIKDNIRYQVDKGGNQFVQTPAALWHSKVGDCKSFAVFAASCLHNLGINGRIRFVSYSKTDKIPKHVYVVVPTGGETIVIDPTPYDKRVYWNTEFGPQHIYDYDMSRLAEIAGIGKRSIGVKKPGARSMYSIGCGETPDDMCNPVDPIGPVKPSNTATLEDQVRHDNGVKKESKVPVWLMVGLAFGAYKLLS